MSFSAIFKFHNKNLILIEQRQLHLEPHNPRIVTRRRGIRQVRETSHTCVHTSTRFGLPVCFILSNCFIKSYGCGQLTLPHNCGYPLLSQTVGNSHSWEAIGEHSDDTLFYFIKTPKKDQLNLAFMPIFYITCFNTSLNVLTSIRTFYFAQRHAHRSLSCFV